MSLKSRNVISFLIGIHLLLMCGFITIAAFDAAHRSSHALFFVLWVLLMTTYLAYAGAMAINNWAFSVIKGWSIIIVSIIPLGSYFIGGADYLQMAVMWMSNLILLLVMNYMTGLIRKHL